MRRFRLNIKSWPIRVYECYPDQPETPFATCYGYTGQREERWAQGIEQALRYIAEEFAEKRPPPPDIDSLIQELFPGYKAKDQG